MGVTLQPVAPKLVGPLAIGLGQVGSRGPIQHHSFGLLLDHLGHGDAAAAITAAVEADIADRAGVAGGTPRSTQEVGEAIAARVAGAVAVG